MVQKKSPPGIKWNNYNDGEIRELIYKKINQLVADRELRKKVGLETGAFKEFKGNSHWNLYLNIEMMEQLNKRLNTDVRNTFVQTTQVLNNTSNFLVNISQQLKNVEYSLGNVTTVANNNVMKLIQSENTKLNKAINNILELDKVIKTSTEKINTNLDQTSKLLNETFENNLKNLLKEVSERTEASQAVITNDIQNLKDALHNKFGEINELVKVNFKETHDDALSFYDKNDESFKKQDDRFTQMDQSYGNLKEKVNTIQETINNRFDDQNNLFTTEIQKGINGILKDYSLNSDKLSKLGTEQTKNIITRVDECTENLTSIIEATNDHLEKVNEHQKEYIKATETEFKKEFKSDIGDIRAILSTIRSDIELMKSVLTKIDTKIH